MMKKRNKISLAALTLMISSSAIIIPAQAQDANTVPSNSNKEQSTIDDKKCGDINAVLIVDNSGSVDGEPEKKKKISNYYLDLIKDFKEMDNDGKITLIPLDHSLIESMYSKTFDLSNDTDYKQLTTIFKDWKFEDHSDNDLWKKDDPLGDNTPGRSLGSNLYQNVKRAQVLNDKHNFNLMITITDSLVETNGIEDNTPLSEIGKNLRDKDVTIKSVVVEVEDRYLPGEKVTIPLQIPKMTSDNPEKNKDYFVTGIDGLGDNIKNSLFEYCKEVNPDIDKPINDKPEPINDKPEHTVSTTIPTSINDPIIMEKTSSDTTTTSSPIIEETTTTTSSTENSEPSEEKTTPTTSTVEPSPIQQSNIETSAPIVNDNPKVATGGHVKPNIIQKIRTLF